MNAIILSIGDELTLGQTIDTNSAWLSQQLAAVGCDIVEHITIPDSQSAIEEAIKVAAPRCDYLIISGGLGPTEDDLTRQALTAVLNVPLELNQPALAHLETFWTRRGQSMPPSNAIQAMIPRGTTMIKNTAGTAPGIAASISASALRAFVPACLRASATTIYIMPGVPKEMKTMFTGDILPEIAKQGGGATILSRTLHTFGLGESTIAEKLGPLMNRTRNPSVGTTVANGYVSLRLNARFATREQAEKEIDQAETLCRVALGDLIFGQDNDTLPQVVARFLLEQKKTVTTAESCTGGLLAKYLTDLPGSSAYFQFGWVTYANEAKQSQLGVRAETLAEHGAVSEQVVEEMAKGALERSNANYALAISGIAGPDGGTASKPVGTVCIGLASSDGISIARTFQLFGDREMIRDRSAKMALTMLRYQLFGKSLRF